MTLTRRGDGAALAATVLLALEGARREGLDLSLAGLRDRVRSAAAEDPLATGTSVVLVSSAIFFAAERGRNDKVRTFGDALAYCATSLSVGYHDVFPRTELGKAITGVLHTLGPALAARALDAPASEARARDEAARAHERAVLERLEEIAWAVRGGLAKAG